MAEIIKETTTQEDNTSTVAPNQVNSGATGSQTRQTTTQRNIDPTVDNQGDKQASGSQTVEYIIYFLFGVLEILLAFRFVLRLLGAGTSSGFVSFIYDLSRVFVSPFNGIFHTSLAPGAETTSVFEPSTLVAILVYALVAWGIVKLIRIASGKKQQTD